MLSIAEFVNAKLAYEVDVLDASAGLASYSCGSASGLSMIDFTLTRSPPTALAMLP